MVIRGAECLAALVSVLVVLTTETFSGKLMLLEPYIIRLTIWAWGGLFIGPILQTKMKKLLLFAVLAIGANAQTPINEAYANKIADAIYIIEGGAKTKFPYGIVSVKTNDPRRVCLNTIRNNWIRWGKAGSKGDFLEFLANRYAPIGAENDPKNLNKNWLPNLRKILETKSKTK